MLRNVVNQFVDAQLINISTGLPVVAGATTVKVTGDDVQSAGVGVISHKGNGLWSYSPTQAETDFRHIAFTFLNPSSLNTTVQLYTSPEGIGVGPFAITITVEDSLAVPIQGAMVALYRTGDYRYGITDINGQVTFYSSAVTWTSVAVIAQGYQFATGTINVIGNMAVTYTGVAIPAPVIVPGQVTGSAFVYDEFGQLENGAIISVQMAKPASLGGIFDSKVAQYTSVAGVVTVGGLFQTAEYDLWRGRTTMNKTRVRIPITSNPTITLPPFMGDDSTDACLT